MKVMNDEKELIAAVKAGKTEQYRPLVERYQTGLIIHCDQLLLDRDAAEDMAQEAFVKAYKNLKRYNPEKAAFSTWLYRIATNSCVDYLRKTKHQGKMPEAELPSEESLTLAEVNHIRKVVRQLQPPEYSKVVQAYFWEGKSYAQIASELNTTTGTIGTWLLRAKSQLRKELL